MYISRIVARVEGNNYRFIYAGNNRAGNHDIIPGERVLVGCVFGYAQRVRGDKPRRLLAAVGREYGVGTALRKYRLFLPRFGQSRLDYFEKLRGIEGFI
jgi:hypothetical protein